MCHSKLLIASKLPNAITVATESSSSSSMLVLLTMAMMTGLLLLPHTTCTTTATTITTTTANCTNANESMNATVFSANDVGVNTNRITIVDAMKKDIVNGDGSDNITGNISTVLMTQHQIQHELQQQRHNDDNHEETTIDTSKQKLHLVKREIAQIAIQRNLPMKNLKRGKRYLDFNKGSRMSWRSTVKNNILKVNTLWGYGWGLRANFPFADKKDRLRPFFKRDVFHAIEDILDGSGFDGRACMLKSFCTALLDVETRIGGGMLFKLLKLIFTLGMEDKRHLPYLREENCQQILHNHCPLSFDNISPFSDES